MDVVAGYFRCINRIEGERMKFKRNVVLMLIYFALLSSYFFIGAHNICKREKLEFTCRCYGERVAYLSCIQSIGSNFAQSIGSTLQKQNIIATQITRKVTEWPITFSVDKPVVSRTKKVLKDKFIDKFEQLKQNEAESLRILLDTYSIQGNSERKNFYRIWSRIEVSEVFHKRKNLSREDLLGSYLINGYLRDMKKDFYESNIKSIISSYGDSKNTSIEDCNEAFLYIDNMFEFFMIKEGIEGLALVIKWKNKGDS